MPRPMGDSFKCLNNSSGYSAGRVRRLQDLLRVSPFLSVAAVGGHLDLTHPTVGTLLGDLADLAVAEELWGDDVGQFMFTENVPTF